MEVKKVSIPLRDLPVIYQILPKYVAPETDVEAETKFNTGLLLIEIKKSVEVFSEQNNGLLKLYKKNIGDGQYGAKLIEKKDENGKKYYEVDEESENKFDVEFKKLSNTMKEFDCPQIPFKTVEKIISGKDIEFLANRFIYFDKSEPKK